MCYHEIVSNVDAKNSKDLLDLILNIFTAVGTVGAVIVAIFYDRIKEFLNKAQIEVKLIDKEGELTSTSPQTLPRASVGPRPGTIVPIGPTGPTGPTGPVESIMGGYGFTGPSEFSSGSPTTVYPLPASQIERFEGRASTSGPRQKPLEPSTVKSTPSTSYMTPSEGKSSIPGTGQGPSESSNVEDTNPPRIPVKNGSGGYGPTDPTGPTNPTAVSGFVGKRIVYYHLKIINKKRRVKVSQCRISLISMTRKRAGDHNFTPVSLTVHPRFYWAPSEYSPQSIDIFTEEILDFGFIVEGIDFFFPSVWPYFNNFEGFIKPSESFQYTLEIIADNLSPKRVIIEITWNDNAQAVFPPTSHQFKIKVGELK